MVKSHQGGLHLNIEHLVGILELWSEVEIVSGSTRRNVKSSGRSHSMVRTRQAEVAVEEEARRDQSCWSWTWWGQMTGSEQNQRRTEDGNR
jgi:hypothetical protein